MLYVGLTNALFILRYTLGRGKSSRNQIYFAVLVGLFLFSAFRYEVGCDWSGYYNQYIVAENLNWSFITANREPVWWAIFSIIHYINLPYPAINIVSSAIFFLGVHFIAKLQPDRLGFLVLLFPILIINMPMSAMRQGAAIGLMCIAFSAFLKRKPISFSFWVVAAAGFHVSALVFLLLLPITTGRYTRNRLLLTAVLALPGVILIAGSNAADIATNRYIDTEREAYGAIFRLGILGLTALYFLIFVRRKWMRYFPQDYSLVNIGVIGMLLSLSLLPLSSIIGDRFGYYLIPIQAIIFARLPYLRFGRLQALHSALPYLGLLLVFSVWAQTSGHFQQCYVPYQSWIFGFPASRYF